MATNPIPAGTRNRTFNVCTEVDLKLGRLVTVQGAPSKSAFVRDLVLDAIEEAERRGLELARDARQLLMPWAVCLVAATGFACVAARALVGESELRRPQIARRVKTGRRDDAPMFEGEEC
jgi:hypothetical protein